MAGPKKIAVLGSTGSVGTQTLDIVRRAAESAEERGEEPPYRIVGLAAHTSIEQLGSQAAEFGPDVVATGDIARVDELASLVTGAEVEGGDAGLVAAIADADVVINAVVGFAGLPVTLETLRQGRTLGLANKESLIAAGPVVARVRSTPGAEIVPVDSEHCAVHQCLRANETFMDGRLQQVARLVITASGGPFRGRGVDELASVTVADALDHPTWSMGPKITIDSSTLMNKGLEVIEANELFGVGFDRIEVVVHPQSVVHSMVEYVDGATIAQLSLPDMRLCIAYAMDHPDRHLEAYGRIDWAELSRLDFEPPDRTAFPCLDLAYEAGRMGGTAPAALSAANEVAVEAFLDGQIGWIDIARAVESVLSQHNGDRDPDLAAVLDADAWARAAAREVVTT